MMEIKAFKAKRTREQISIAVDAILDELEMPETSLHQRSLAAFKRGDFDYVRDLSAMHLNDFYCKSLGYLTDIYESPNFALALALAGRAAADFAREKVLIRLGAINAKIL